MPPFDEARSRLRAHSATPVNPPNDISSAACRTGRRPPLTVAGDQQGHPDCIEGHAAFPRAHRRSDAPVPTSASELVLVASREARAAHTLIERHLRTGGEQPGRLGEADLGSVVVPEIEEDGAGAGPQALALADDRCGVCAVDLAAEHSCRRGEARIERGDLERRSRAPVQARSSAGLEFVDAVDVEQSPGRRGVRRRPPPARKILSRFERGAVDWG